MTSLLQRRPRYLWLAAYLLINIVYTIAISVGGHLFGESEMVTISRSTPVLLISTLLIGSYILLTGVFFEFVSKIKVPKIRLRHAPEVYSSAIGRGLLILQILFIIYFVTTGTYVAGSVKKDSSILSQIWVLIPVDILFFVYYGFYRKSKLFKYNFIVWLISNFARGWSSVILTAIFFESCRLIRSGKLKLRHCLIAIPTLTILYPIVYFGKLFIRFNSYNTDAGWSGFIATLDSINLGDAMKMAMAQIFDRLQIISDSIAMYEKSADLQNLFKHGMVYSYWQEGIHGLALDRIIGASQSLDMGKALASILDPLTTDINWNANPTLIGWFFVLPWQTIAILGYTLVLCFATFFLTKTMASNPEAEDMVWYGWIVLLIPGWYGAFILLLYSLVLFFFGFCLINLMPHHSLSR
jgi:hypothetical protein